MVGVEPTTCSPPDYRASVALHPDEQVVEVVGIEPTTPWSRTKCPTRLGHTSMNNESGQAGALTGRVRAACRQGRTPGQTFSPEGRSRTSTGPRVTGTPSYATSGYSNCWLRLGDSNPRLGGYTRPVGRPDGVDHLIALPPSGGIGRRALWEGLSLGALTLWPLHLPTYRTPRSAWLGIALPPCGRCRGSPSSPGVHRPVVPDGLPA